MKEVLNDKKRRIINIELQTMRLVMQTLKFQASNRQQPIPELRIRKKVNEIPETLRTQFQMSKIIEY